MVLLLCFDMLLIVMFQVLVTKLLGINFLDEG